MSGEDNAERKEMRMMEKILLVVFGMLVGGALADVPVTQKSAGMDLYGTVV